MCTTYDITYEAFLACSGRDFTRGGGVSRRAGHNVSISWPAGANVQHMHIP